MASRALRIATAILALSAVLAGPELNPFYDGPVVLSLHRHLGNDYEIVVNCRAIPGGTHYITQVEGYATCNLLDITAVQCGNDTLNTYNIEVGALLQKNFGLKPNFAFSDYFKIDADDLDDGSRYFEIAQVEVASGNGTELALGNEHGLLGAHSDASLGEGCSSTFNPQSTMYYHDHGLPISGIAWSFNTVEIYKIMTFFH